MVNNHSKAIIWKYFKKPQGGDLNQGNYSKSTRSPKHQTGNT